MIRVLRILVLVFLTQLATLTSAQEVLLVDTDNHWYSKLGIDNWTTGNPYAYILGQRMDYFDGDTVINNMLYQQLYTIKADSNYIYNDELNEFIFQSVNNPISVQYRAAFRQEGDVVYFLLPFFEEEQVYMDFDVEVGEDFNYYYFEPGAQTVTDIQNVLFAGTTIRAYELNDGQWWCYEGIGFSHGLFKDVEYGHHGDYYLLCFSTQTDELHMEHDVAQYWSNCPIGVFDTQECLGDLNDDGEVDTADFVVFLSQYGCTSCDIDFNGDGQANGQDLLVMLSASGTLCH